MFAKAFKKYLKNGKLAKNIEKEKLAHERALCKESPLISLIYFDKTWANDSLKDCYGRYYHAEYFEETKTERIQEIAE